MRSDAARALVHFLFTFVLISQVFCVKTPGSFDCTFAVQTHTEPKYQNPCDVRNVFSVSLLINTRSINHLIQEVVFLFCFLLLISGQEINSAGEVWHWLNFIYPTASWQVSSTSLEVTFNPKGQTLLVNLGIWKPLWPVSKIC